MLAEAKAEIVRILAKKYFERKPAVVLEEVRGPTLESAEVLNKEQGNYKESADHYNSVYLQSEDREVRVKALLGCTQQLINIGSYAQALRFLTMRSGYISDNLPFSEQVVFDAQVEAKKGWISDYTFDYRGAIRYFLSAAETLSKIPQSEWSTDTRELYSTTRHFLGRSCYGMAYFGIHRKENLLKAKQFFGEACGLDANYEGIDKNAKLGFGHAWLARCYILDDNRELADQHIQNSLNFFNQQLIVTPENRGSFAQGQLLQGERELVFGTAESARGHFKEALSIRQNETPYPRGEADAYLGIALSYKKQWNISQFLRYAKLARQTNIGVFKRLLGG